MKHPSSSKYIKDISKEYAIYTCENRAIPKVTDGLKDSYRKMLWVIRNQASEVKTIALAGQAISSGLYVHGDTSASGAISMMAGPYCNNVPLLEGHGLFGSRVATTDFAAPRYTYVKRGKITEKLMYPDLDIVPLKENYDGSAVEPVTFLPIIPIVLLNGISGMAVGWSTDILPHNLSDIIDASISALDNKKVKQLEPNYSYLDCKVDQDGDSWRFSGRCEIVDSSTIRVTELPPGLSLEKFKDRLNKLEEDDKINSYTDSSTKVIDIEVKMPRGSIKGWTEEKAIDYLKLTFKKKERIVVIGWNSKSIMQYESPEELVKDFVEWRVKWYYTRYEHLKERDSEELRFWRGVKECFDQKLPSKLSNKQNRKEVEEEVASITNKIGLTEEQINRIVSFASYRWTIDEYQKTLDKIESLEKNIEDYDLLLSDDDLIRGVYKEELKELKKEKFHIEGRS